MKKLLTALGAAAVIATMTMPVSAEKLWKYSETVTIDLAEARYKPTTDGHDILEFVAVEQLPDGTCRWQKRSTREKYIRSKPWTPFMKK